MKFLSVGKTLIGYSCPHSRCARILMPSAGMRAGVRTRKRWLLFGFGCRSASSTIGGMRHRRRAARSRRLRLLAAADEGSSRRETRDAGALAKRPTRNEAVTRVRSNSAAMQQFLASCLSSGCTRSRDPASEVA